ncbi:hypothetical protein ACLB2K_027554 [Fragaria x ananassa]
MNEISQIQLGKNKRKILPYQAAKDEPPSSSSMDTEEGERQAPPESGHTVGDKRKTIDNWVASVKLTQALVLSKFGYEDAHAYYKSTLTGIVQKWYQPFKRSSQWADWAIKLAQTNSPLDFVVPIYAQFCGNITGHSEQSKEQAKKNIQKLSICNMKYFEEYTNEFQNYFCTIGDIENEDLIITYYKKLSEPRNDAVAQSLKENPLQYFTVGGIAERVRDLLRKQFTKNRKSKTSKKQLRGVENMCPKILDTLTQWGCHIPKERKYRKKFSSIKHDTGFEYSLAKRYAIPEEYWEKSSRTVTGVAMEENKIVMDTMARNVRVSLGGGNFTIKIF